MEEEEKVLSVKDNCSFIITQKWLFISKLVRFIDTAERISTSEQMCGLICDTNDNGQYYDAVTLKETGAVDAFYSTVKKVGAEVNKSWNVYRIYDSE